MDRPIGLPTLSIPVYLDIAPIGRQDAEVRAAAAAIAEAAAAAFRERFNAATAEAGKGMAEGIERSTESARSAAGGLADTAAKEVDKRLGEDTGKKAAEGVARGIEGGSRDAKGAGRQVGEAGAEGVAEGLGKTAGQGAAADLADGMSAGRNNVQDAGREMGQAGAEGIAEGLGEGAGRKAAEDMAAGMKAGETPVRDAAADVARAASSALDTGVGTEAGERATGAFAEGMDRQREQVEAAAGRVADASSKALDTGLGGEAGERTVREFGDGVTKATPQGARKVEGFSNAVVAKFREAFGIKEGEDAGRRVADGIERQFRLAQADITESLARGLISQREADRMGREAGAAYKAALLAEIERRSAANTLSEDDFLELTDRLGRVGAKGGEELNQGLLGKIRDLPGIVQGVIATGVVAVVVRGMQRATDAVAGFARAVGETARLTRGFSALTRGRGLAPAEVLRDLQDATLGTVRSNDLMRQSNLLLNSTLPITSKQIGELAYLSRRLAESMGRDAAQGFQQMSDGIVRMRTTTLSQMGVVVRVEDAVRRWAEANGKTVQSMTEAERQLAIYNAVVDQARTKVAALGDEQVDAGTRVDQAAVFWDELKNATLLAIAETPRVVEFFDAIGVGAENASEKIQDLADEIAAFLTVHGRAITGIIAGGAAGAVAGSFIPGVGTAVGGLGGAAFGGIYGTGSDMLAGGGPGTREAEKERRRHVRSRNELLEEIRNRTDIVELQRQRARLQTEINDLQRQGLGTSERTREAQEELAATDEGIRRARAEALRREAEEQERMTAEQQRAAETAQRALEERIRAYAAFEPMREMTGDTWEVPQETEAKLQRIFQIESELLQIEKEIAEARGQAPAGIQAIIDERERELAALRASVQATRDQWENLPDVEARVTRTVGLAQRALDSIESSVVGAVANMDGAWLSTTSGINRITRALEEAADAEEELQRARLAQDPARIAAALKRQEAAHKAVADATARAMGIFEAAAESGAIDQTELNRLIAEMIELLEAAGISAEDFTDTGTDWQSLARTIEGVARGVLSIADALGIVDQQGRRTLQGLVDVAGGIGRIATSGGKDIGAWMQAAGGALGLIQGVFGASPEDVRRLERHRSAMRDLEIALLELRDAYLGNLSTEEVRRDVGNIANARMIGQTLANELGAHAMDGRPTLDWRTGVVAQPSNWRADWSRGMNLVGADATDREADAALAVFFGDLDRKYGTQLRQLLEQGDWRTILDQLPELYEDLIPRLGNLGDFGDDVAGNIERINYELDLMGERDTANRIAAITSGLMDAGVSFGDFQDELEELAGLDLSTEEGRARRDEIIAELRPILAAGEGTFGDVSWDQGREIFLDWATATPTVEPEDPEPIDTTVADTLARIRFELDALGVTDPVERIRATIQALRDAGVSFGEFRDELAELDSLDLTTVEGQTRQGDIIAEMVARMAAEGADFGGLDPQALRQIVLEYARAAGEVAPEETVARGVDRSVTETTMRREVSLLTTIAYWQEQAARYLAAMSGDSAALPVAQVTYSPVDMPPPLTVADLTAGFQAALHAFQFPPVYVEVIQPPSPAALGLTPPAAPNIHNEINLGGIHVDLQTVERVDEATIQRLAGTISDLSDRKVSEMDHALAERIREMERALGYPGGGRRV